LNARLGIEQYHFLVFEHDESLQRGNRIRQEFFFEGIKRYLAVTFVTVYARDGQNRKGEDVGVVSNSGETSLRTGTTRLGRTIWALSRDADRDGAARASLTSGRPETCHTVTHYFQTSRSAAACRPWVS
jgi:hypothetical protein